MSKKSILLKFQKSNINMELDMDSEEKLESVSKLHLCPNCGSELQIITLKEVDYYECPEGDYTYPIKKS